jgi:hypothetical protein
MSRVATTFGLLIACQAVHSVEECVGRLWESYPPARFVAGLVSTDLGVAFSLLNVAVVAFGAWCLIWPVRRQWSSAPALIWFWISVETLNGIAHLTWSFWQRSYTPGVATAPFLLIIAISLALQMRRGSRG